MAETNEERLERIKTEMPLLRSALIGLLKIKYPSAEFDEEEVFLNNDFDWLIEQAERVQELEEAIEQKSLSIQTKHHVYVGPDDSVSYKLLKDNNHLRDELQKIADIQLTDSSRTRYQELLTVSVLTARQALRVSE